MDSSSQLVLEDFGQKVDLTRRIREVLLNYPEGTTVLKELIQNADDAGATVVKLCLDKRSHRTESLLSPALAQWQGPALLAYNNGVFNEEDFKSISRIGGSGKQGQAWKTGRFGKGAYCFAISLTLAHELAENSASITAKEPIVLF
ncbi:zinc finger, C3HC4 type containing protein [Tanacetum coccineum]